jgi:predicted acyl esterase
MQPRAADVDAANEWRLRVDCVEKLRMERPALMVPGEVYAITIELFPIANLYCCGHRR